jgi:hypothetical protein
MTFYGDWPAVAGGRLAEQISRTRLLEQARSIVGVQLPESAAVDGAIAEMLASTSSIPFLDLRNPLYAGGARGDGVTNESQVVQAAYNAAVAAGGGVIWNPFSVSGVRIGSSLALNGNVPVLFMGPGRYVATTDLKPFFITGSLIEFWGTIFDRTPAAGTQAVFSIEGGSDIRLIVPKISGAPLYAIYCNAASKIKMLSPRIFRPYDHAIYIRDACDDIEIIGGDIIEPGFGNASVGSGKGVGLHGIGGQVTNVRIANLFISDPNNIAVELFGNSGTNPGVKNFSIDGVIVKQTKAANGNRFGISFDTAQNGAAKGCIVEGTEKQYEVAGGCKRVQYSECEGHSSLGAGCTVSNANGPGGANDPDMISLADFMFTAPAGKGIEVLNAKSIVISNPQIDSAGDRGLMLNSIGSSSKAQVRGGFVKNGVKAGVYVFMTGATTGQAWDIEGVNAEGNNTSVSAGEDDIYVNADSQAHVDGLRFLNNRGRVTSSFVITRRISARDYGVKYDNATLCLVQLQRAADAAQVVGSGLGSASAILELEGIALVENQFVVPKGVRVVGVSERISGIRAGAGFPNATAVVRLGRVAETQCFGTSVERLAIDCNSKTGSIGLYSNSIMEHAGARDVLVLNWMAKAIWIETSGAQNAHFEHIECNIGAGAPAGSRAIHVDATGGRTAFVNVTLNGNGAAVQGDGLVLTGGAVATVFDMHGEHVDYVIRLISGAGTFVAVDGHASVLSVIRYEGGAGFRAGGIYKLGSTNSIQDIANGVTLTSDNQDYWVGAPDSANGWFVRGNKIIGVRSTGWTAPTGTVSKGTFDQSTVTLPQLAQRVAALINDLTTHGLIGP